MLISFIGYRIIHNTITQNHENEVEILILDTKDRTNDLVSQLLYQYTTQKDILIQKHKEVSSYLNQHSYDVDLQEIKKRINIGYKDSPYDIYITDENLTIKNTTYAPDLGFHLGFAKQTFDEHFDKGEIGCSLPILEKSHKKFLSYTDSYYGDNDNAKAGVLQISYNYLKSMELYSSLKKQIAYYNNSTDLKAYIFVDYAHRYELPHKWMIYKSDLQGIQFTLRDDLELLKQLKNSTVITKSYVEDETNYRAVFISSESVIIDDIQIIQSILIDETKFFGTLKNFNFGMILVTLVGIIAIFIIYNIRKKETRLSEQDRFVQHSMHEIKTPLSVITLNNELRELEFGEDEYSLEIDSAIKLLKTSYDDMSFTITKDELDYPSETAILSEVLSGRIEYFKTIAKSKSKSISLEVNSDCKVNISLVELTRLIDNNLSNAIKYSDNNSNIDITLENDILSFRNRGKPIKETGRIFEKYYRENSVIGGHGLGLSIVKDIAKKYSIDIELNSDEKNGTTFKYRFKCHTDDISSQ